MSVKLPASVKQLLALRNPHALPSPPLPNLHMAFASTFDQAQKHRAERGWLVMATSSLLTANCPPAVAHLYRYATADRQVLDSRLNAAAVMRESALKSCIFVGVPRTILTLAALHEAWEDDVRESLRKHSVRSLTSSNVDEFLQRGRDLWKSIYEPHDVKLQDKLGSHHPDFPSFILQSYGTVLAPMRDDQEAGNLSRALGSVVGIACLRAEEGVVPQLISHVFGLLKARNIQNLEPGDVWLASDEGTEWLIKAVDTICDAVRDPNYTSMKARM